MINDNERYNIEVEDVEDASSINTEELQEEIKNLRDTNIDYRAEIDHIRADNSVLKEAIVRLQLRSLGLME